MLNNVEHIPRMHCSLNNYVATVIYWLNLNYSLAEQQYLSSWNVNGRELV